MIFFWLLFFFFFVEVEKLLSSDFATVLVYHRFDEDKYPSTNIKRETFLKHLNFLKENNFNVLPLSKLILFLREKKSLPEKSVFITIDDAYKSVYEIAYPLLKKFNYPFTVFVSTNNVAKNNSSNFMTWTMLNEINDNFGSIENHTSNHSYANSISNEDFITIVKKASNEIKKNVGKKSELFSFPYGESSLEKEEEIEKLGFALAFSQHSSHVTRNENLFRLPRFALNDQYGTLERFKMILESRPLEVSDIIPKDNLILKNKPNIIGFSSAKPVDLINCFNSDNLVMDFKKKKPNKLVIIIKERIRSRRLRINCTYVNKNEVFWYGRMLNK